MRHYPSILYNIRLYCISKPHITNYITFIVFKQHQPSITKIHKAITKSGGSNIPIDIFQQPCTLIMNSYVLYLDENNQLTRTTAKRDKFERIGDCYNVLNADFLWVSYNDIIDEDNLIWIEFDFTLR